MVNNTVIGQPTLLLYGNLYHALLYSIHSTVVVVVRFRRRDEKVDTDVMSTGLVVFSCSPLSF